MTVTLTSHAVDKAYSIKKSAVIALILTTIFTAFLIYLSWLSANCPCEWSHSCPRGFGYGHDCDPRRITSLQFGLDYLAGSAGLILILSLALLGIAMQFGQSKLDAHFPPVFPPVLLAVAASMFLFRLFLENWAI